MCDVWRIVLGAKTEHFILKREEYIIFGVRVNELYNFGPLYSNWKSGRRSRWSHNYQNWITEGWNYSDWSNECMASFASCANKSWELRIKWMWGLILLQYSLQLSHAGSSFLFRNMILIFLKRIFDMNILHVVVQGIFPYCVWLDSDVCTDLTDISLTTFF